MLPGRPVRRGSTRGTAMMVPSAIPSSTVMLWLGAAALGAAAPGSARTGQRTKPSTLVSARRSPRRTTGRIQLRQHVGMVPRL